MNLDFNAALANASQRREEAERAAKQTRQEEVNQLVGEIVYTINSAASSETTDPRPLLTRVKDALDGTAVQAPTDARLQQQLQDAQDTIAGLQQEVNDLRDANAQLTSSNDQLTQAAQTAGDPQVVTNLRMQLQTLQTRRDDLVTENADLKTENQELKTAKGRLETDLRNAQAPQSRPPQPTQPSATAPTPVRTSAGTAPAKKTSATAPARATTTLRPSTPAPAAKSVGRGGKIKGWGAKLLEKNPSN